MMNMQSLIHIAIGVIVGVIIARKFPQMIPF